jgi:hypothetical protein
MTHVVLEHHHDPEAGLYRLVVGTPVEDEVPVLDEDGEQLLDEVDAPDGDGTISVPRTERQVIDYVDQFDIVFSADDTRWLDSNGKSKPAAEIAKVQRRLVKEALAARAAASSADAVEPPPVKSLPGAGETL